MDNENSLAISLFGEILALDQLVRNRLAKVLPKGMELSHFSVLNQLSHTKIERTPAQIAKSFRVTRGAITNTCLLYTSPSPRDLSTSRMPSSA